MNKKVILLSVFIFLFFAVSIVTKANIPTFDGLARDGAVQFVIEDTVYVGLGYNETGALNDFWKYSKKTGVWERIADFGGVARTNAVAFSINGKGYVGLGRENYSSSPLRDFYSYDPKTDQWTKMAEDFGGEARHSAVSFTINNIAYVGTGAGDSGVFNDFWIFNGSTWTQMTSTFTGDKRRSASAFVIDGKGYVTGGFYIDSYTVQLNDIQAYDPTTNKWTEKVFADGVNLSINNATALTYKGEGYIFYGNKSTIVKYNPITNQVENLGDTLGLGNERNNPISFILGGIPYFGLGSYTSTTTVYTKDIIPLIEVFSISGYVKTEEGGILSSYNIHPRIIVKSDGSYKIEEGVNGVEKGDTLTLNSAPDGYEFYPKKIILNKTKTLDIVAYKGIVHDEFTVFNTDTIRWNADTVNVFANIRVVKKTLIISAGTKVKFHRYCNLKIVDGDASIFAIGTNDKPIIFTSANPAAYKVDLKTTDGAWGGIEFGNESYSSYKNSSKFEYCRISYAKNLSDSYYAYSNNGGGIRVEIYDNILFKNCEISFNSAKNGGGIYLMYADVRIENCYIHNNNSPSADGWSHTLLTGGAGLNIDRSNPLIVGCNVNSNKSDYNAGGIMISSSSTPTILNCNIVNNIARNSQNEVYSDGARATIINSIIWGSNINKVIAGSNLFLYNSCVHGGNVFNATAFNNCQDLDPLFVDALNNNYSLQSNSPYINMGTDSLLTEQPKYDINGNIRLMGSKLDAGAFEHKELTLLINAKKEVFVGESIDINGEIFMGTATSWSWDFNGDGITDSDIQNNKYAYTKSGKYIVKLISDVTELGRKDTAYHNINVLPNPPSAKFSVDIIYGDAPTTIAFKDLSTGYITSWKWDFGDGETSNNQNPSHTYTKRGIYTVKLRLTGETIIDSLVKKELITIGPMEVDFNASPLSGIFPLAVGFKSAVNYGKPNKWSWDFNGDNIEDSNLEKPYFTYKEPGYYTVSLTVYDPFGNASKTKTDYILVNDPFSAESFSIYSYSPTCFNSNDGKIKITSTLSDANVIVQEIFEGRWVSAGTSYVFDHLSPGTYHLSVKIGQLERKFVVNVENIAEIDSKVSIEGNTATFNISGGVAPYIIQIGNSTYKTETGRLTVNHLNSRTYSAIVKDNNSCTKDVKLNFSTENLKIYPNPIENGKVFISINDSFGSDLYAVSIVDIQGNAIIKELHESTNITLDVSKLPKGMYFLNIVGHNYQEIKKIIVK